MCDQLTRVVEAMIVAAVISEQLASYLRYAQLSQCLRQIEPRRVVQLQAPQRKALVLLPCLIPLHLSRPLMLVALSRAILQRWGLMI